MSDDWIKQAASLSRKSNGLYLSPQEARRSKASGRLLELLPIAEQIACPGISGFRVGAVAVGASGAIYFGANLEFPGSSLLHTVHAEQAAVLNARTHGESHIKKLAVSALPCGRCRQFLSELERGPDIEIITTTAKPARLAEWFPKPFGPADLKIEGGFFAPRENPIATPAEPLDDLAEQAFEAARRCYAPYTAAYAGIALQFPDGSAVTGPYIENAAFNPSLLPLQSALVDVALHGLQAVDIRTAVLVQAASGLVDHEASTRELLAAAASQGRLSMITLRANR
jgi:cytidine deaminase